MRNKADLLSGLLIGGFGTFVLYESVQLPYLSEFGPGPGFLPFWLSVGIVALGTFLLASAIVKPELLKRDSWKIRPLAGWAGFVVSIALLDRLGFVLSLALLTCFILLVMEQRSLKTALGVTAGLALAFYVIFVVSLGVPLPLGPLGF